MSTKTPPRRPRAFAADDPTIVASPAASTIETGPNPETTSEATQAPVGSGNATAVGGSAPGDGARRTRAPGPGATDAAPIPPPPRLFGWGRVLLGAMTGLVLLLVVGSVVDLATAAMARNDWIGISITALAALAALAAAVLIAREVFGLLRLARLSRLRRDADAALRKRDATAEAAVVRRLVAHAKARPDRAWDLARFREEERHMREPGQRLGLADRVLLAGPDREARRIVYESARRVGVLTAVVPIAALDVVLVLAETLRMIRRLAEAYGGRPGALGALRLLWWVIGHIAATGAVALTDDFLGQVLGQGLARGLSRRVGEGAVNAALTARLGAAAIELIRPLPYVEAPRIRARSIVAELIPDLNPAELTRSLLRRARR